MGDVGTVSVRAPAAAITTHTRDGQGGTELYISARPPAGVSPGEQAEAVFAAIRAVLTASDACLFQERIFAAPEAFTQLDAVRARVYGDLDDGVPPTRLGVPVGWTGGMAGVQVHAIRTARAPAVVRVDGSPCGRTMAHEGTTCIALSGISDPTAVDPPVAAGAMFTRAAAALESAGTDMRSVVRTWVWLGDILSWYPDFNRVRTAFYTAHGLVQDAQRYRLPASTGVGIAPADGARCALDVFAVVDEHDDIGFAAVGSHQPCAFEYGSAFSRAARVATPTGATVFVSGTAAIDGKGETEHPGDVAGQIAATLGHVRAILRDMGCTDRDVVQAIAYCKTAGVEQAVGEMDADWSCPWITVISDICRPGLLFELEVTAWPGSGTPGNGTPGNGVR